MIDIASNTAPPYALSSSQMNIWNLERAFSGTSMNTITAAIRISGVLDISALQMSLDAVLRADGQLRVRVTEVNGSPCQYISPYKKAVFRVYDFTSTDRAGLAHWEESVAREAMPLIDSPLYDFRIYKESETEGGVLVKLHHIISDGWSQVLLSNSIAEAYFALISGQSAEVRAAEPYSLHIKKEEEYRASRAHGRDAAFWRERLASFGGPSSAKECVSASVSTVGRRKTYALSHLMNHAIRDFCAKNSIAPFALYYMALAIYLGRVTGSNRSIIGVPVFNRADFKDKNTVGMFVSTLPFLGELDENWSFERFSRELSEQWFELLRHQRLPFSEIMSAAREADAGITSLFHIVLSYQTSRIYKSADASVTFSGRWHYSGYQSEHLIIHLSSMGDDYRFSVDYDYLTQIFSEEDIDTLHSYLTSILAAALAEPETPVWKLPMMGRDEKEKVLFTFNQTDAPLPFADVASMFLHAAKVNSRRAAIISGGERLTYGGLARRAADIARAIEQAAPGGGRVIALCLEKGAALASSIMAVALSGNTWLTLPEDTPPLRLGEILGDAKAALLIAGADTVSPAGMPRLDVAGIAGEDEIPYEPKPQAAAAYSVFTSGSTGRPKGVLIGQESAVNLASALKGLYGHGAVLSLCSVGFDVFVMECAASLMNGRTIVFPTAAEQESPEAVGALIRDYAVGNIALPPSRLEAYMRSPAFLASLSGVERIICGGEHFPPELVKTLRQHTGAEIYNQYGPSETAVAVSARLMNDASSITIGRPMQNCRLYILDAHLQPMPIGVFGELYVGGKCVGLGYCADTKANAAFMDSPFESGERLYRTGDVASWTKDGEIVLRGRRDSQVKLRGLRIEPGEIAARLSAHGEITAAAVRLLPRGKSALIAAYYTAPREISAAELTAFMRSYLPAYMLPGAYTRLESMPLTANGKIDLASLPEPVARGGASAGGAAEEAVLKAMRASLGRDDIDADTDYFLAGGDSLTAMETISAIEAATGTRLSVSDIYAHRTAARLALALEGSAAAKHEEIPAVPSREYYPATSTQVSLYFESESAPGSLAYNMPGYIRLPKGADARRLHGAFVELIRREKLLRTGFEVTGEGVVQHVREDVAFALEELHAADINAAAALFIRPFDTAVPPLMRAALLRAGDGGDYLFFDTHHLISDGLTAPLLLKKLDDAYHGRPAKTGAQFPDYALAAADRRMAAETEGYWRRTLSDAPDIAPLPADEPLGEAGDGKKLRFALSKRAVSAMESAVRKFDVTPYMYLVSAFALLCRALTGEEDMLIGTPASGRTAAELWDMCGPFIRPLPLRIKLDGASDAEGFLKYVKGQTLSLIANQDADADALLRIARGEGGGKLFDVLFSMRPTDGDDFIFLDERVTPVELDTGYAKFPLSMEAARAEGGYCITMEYASGRIFQETAELWARSFTAIAERLAFARLIGDIDPLDPADRFALFDEPDSLTAPYPAIPIDVRILDAARRMPGADAIRFHGKTMDFASLAERSQRVALALAALGVRRGDAVMIAMERSPALIEAMLGVLMAGCAYVMALTSFPEGRLSAMAGSSSARLLVSDSEAVIAMTGLPCKTLPFGRLAAMEAADADLPAPGARSPEDGAYILFTSGTTGAPKGAVVTHGSLSNLLEAMRPVLGTESKRILCATNSVFDIFITESLLALAMGKCVVLADGEEMLLPHGLAALISGEGVDAAQLTPSRLRLCLGSEPFRLAAGRVRRMLVAGEALLPGLADAWYAASEGTLYNLYGPTECTVYATFTQVPRGAARITIGRPVMNCRVYIMDKNLRRVMPTAAGEIYIAGACVSAGYAGDAQLSEASFLPDPVRRGARMYKSGDAGRLNAAGEIEFLGRLDSQLKLNGLRIEPGEISARALALEGVLDAATVTVTGENGEKRLRLCVVCRDGVDANTLRLHLEKTLPKYMLPAETLFMDAIAKNASGKADMRALASPELAAKEPAGSGAPKGDHAASVTETAEAIAAVWRAALHRETLARDATFFEQGGGSLGVLDVLSRYYSLGLKLSVSEFYSHPTIDGQAALICGRTEAAAAPRPAPAAAVPMPLRGGSSGQRARRVLLTGATGFLGIHVLRALIERGAEHVTCLVRGGEDRLASAAGRYFGKDWFSENRRFISAVRGDIGKPLMGLDEKTLGELEGRTDVLLHCAADVRHHVADEAASLSANAGGTANAVRVAARLGARLAYVSTMSVGGAGRLTPFTEDDPPCDAKGQGNVYVRGKCASELIVRRCAGLLPGVLVLRIGRLVGRASDGMFIENSEGNAFYSFMRGALTLEKFPESARNIPIELTPVDECASAVAMLISGRGAVYHVFNPHMLTFAELAAALRGREAEFVGDAGFRRYLDAEMRSRPGSALFGVKEMWELFGASALGDSVERCERTAAELAEGGFVWTKSDVRVALRDLCQ